MFMIRLRRGNQFRRLIFFSFLGETMNFIIKRTLISHAQSGDLSPAGWIEKKISFNYC